MNVEDRKREIVVSKSEIAKRVEELGKELSIAYENKNLLIISLLKGSFIFTADLVRQITVPVHIEFMITSSYGHSEESSGELHIEKDIEVDDLSMYDVLIVDDIIDSGVTMFEIMKLLKTRNPKSIKSCTLLNKPSRRVADVKPDYCGFEIPDMFIVGYGLNYQDYYRNIDHVFAFVEA